MSSVYFYNHCAYNCPGKNLDEEYARCEKQCGNTFPHTCIYWLEQGDTEKGYENVTWCMKHRKE